MAVETEWQRKIVKQVSIEGGDGFKWSVEYNFSRPDIILMHEKFDGPLFIEVKREIGFTETTDRKLDVRENQHRSLTEMKRHGCRCFILAVLVTHPHLVHVVPKLHDPSQNNVRVTGADLRPEWRWRPGSLKFVDNLASWVKENV